MSFKPDPFQEAFLREPHSNNSAVKLSAVAGAGKTTTSVMKIKSLIEDYNIPPEEIVFITFSNKSARDLHKKYNELTGLKSRPHMSTCHSFSLYLLKKYYKLKPTLLNDWGSILIMRDALEYLGIDKKYNIDNKKALSAKATEFLELTHWFKSNLMARTPILYTDLSDFNYKEYQNHPDVDVGEKDFIQAFQKYEEYKSNSKQVDYSDLLYNLYVKLLSDKETLSKIKSDHKVFFIDECQDNDTLLFNLIYLLSSGNSLYMIYDLAQTIYGFRWASPWLLDDHVVSNHFKEVKNFSLEFNYRSTENIVSIGNKARSSIPTKNFELVMSRPSKPSSKGSVRFITVKNNKAEGANVSRLISDYISEGYKLSDIAVISRTNNYLKTIIEPALSKDAIPYRLATKSRKKLFDKPIIQVYFSFISYLTSPSESTLMGLATHVKGIGDSFLSKMKSLSYMGKSIFSVSLSPADTSKVNKLRALGQELESLTTVNTPSNLIEVIRGFENLIALYFPADFTTKTDLELIGKSLQTMVFTYYDDFGIMDLHEIFDKILLDFTDIQTEDVPDSIVLMTVHGSKGLEFPVTIVGDFAQTSGRTSDSFDDGCILYVQLSRAKDKLAVLHSLKYVDYKMVERDASYSVPYQQLIRKLGV